MAVYHNILNVGKKAFTIDLKLHVSAKTASAVIPRRNVKVSSQN